jgi:hypothetical protein
MPESLATQLRQCKTPAEALQFLAGQLEAANERIAAVEKQLTETGADVWGAPLEWAVAEPEVDASKFPGAPSQVEANAATAQQRKIAGLEAKIAETHDPDELRALEATLRLAREEHVRLPSPDVVASVGEEVIGEGWNSLAKPATPEQVAARMQWAAEVKLEEYMRTADALKMARDAGGDDVEQLYAWFGTVGPRGLFTADHIACLQLPLEARRWLVTHMMEEDETLAKDMGADLLKSEDSLDRETARELYEPTWQS